MSYKPNLNAHMPAASLNAAGSVHSPSTSMATSSQYRQLLSDYGPPSLGYTQAVLSQEEKQARTLERDRLKKRRQREDGLKRSLERQRNALAMKLQQEDGWEWEKERAKEWEAKRRRRASVEEPEDRETVRRQWQKREEQARALQWKMATLVQRWEKDCQQEGRPTGEASACRPAANPTGPIWGTGNSQVPQSKYAELLAIIEELGKEIRPTYAGSKSAMERLKRGIIHARGLVRECLAETERNARS